MARYNAEFPFAVAFPPQAMTNVLAEWLSKKGLKQAHIAGRTSCIIVDDFTTDPIALETEKYAHVTFFFNGGVEKQFEQEMRHMIPSPKVATYDMQPEMSAQGVADKVVEVLATGEQDFVMCNFAPPDMVRQPIDPQRTLRLTPLKVGHTGVFEAAVEGVTATDRAVGTIYEAAQKHGYVLLITADHGNAEQMKDPETGNPHTAHTTNVVPFLMAALGDSKDLKFKEDRKTEAEGKEGEEDPPALCDVAPTVLDIMVRFSSVQNVG